VLADKGAVLCTVKLDRIIALDESRQTVSVQSGVVLADLDAFLGTHGYGLPVIGDHNDITAGGFASVGGISPSSHRYGMFVDNVSDLQYVDWDGEVINCGRTLNPELFYRVLAGTGQHGVIVSLTLDVIRVDKLRTVLKNERSIFRNADQFIESSSRLIMDPSEAVLQRSFWFDFGRTRIGQVSIYKDTPQTMLATARNVAAYKYLHTLGHWGGRLPKAPDLVVKCLGLIGMILAPKMATIKNIETFTDRVMDSTVGDPTRMLIILAPAAEYPALFRGLYKLALEYKKRHKCFTFISLYAKAIRSRYLGRGNPDALFCELLFVPGIKPQNMTQELLESLVSRIDDMCIEHGAFRYMHTKTSKDPERRARIDPNAFYAKNEGRTIRLHEIEESHESRSPIDGRSAGAASYRPSSPGYKER
jgi:hypothetical protein